MPLCPVTGFSFIWNDSNFKCMALCLLQRYTGELRSVTGERAVAAVLLLQGAALALSAAGLLADMPQKGGREGPEAPTQYCFATPVPHTSYAIAAAQRFHVQRGTARPSKGVPAHTLTCADVRAFS